MRKIDKHRVHNWKAEAFLLKKQKTFVIKIDIGKI